MGIWTGEAEIGEGCTRGGGKVHVLMRKLDRFLVNPNLKMFLKDKVIKPPYALINLAVPSFQFLIKIRLTFQCIQSFLGSEQPLIQDQI